MQKESRLQHLTNAILNYQDLDPNQNNALQHFAKLYDLNINHQESYEHQFECLVSWIDHLIHNDFNRLLSILYRIDVSEEKIKNQLKASQGLNPAHQIARLIIEREKEKIKYREIYSQNKDR